MKPCLVDRAGRGHQRIPPLPSGGPIEAKKSDSAGESNATFHRYQAVAPLKPFRSTTVPLISWPFHRYQAVAPLKPLSRNAAIAQLRQIPPLPSGGPIEAHRDPRQADARSRIPPLPSGGPIEAAR